MCGVTAAALAFWTLLCRERAPFLGTHIWSWIHGSRSSHRHIRVRASTLHAHIHAHTRTYTHIHTTVHTYIIHAHTQGDLTIRTQTHTYADTRAHTHADTHTHTHTHTRARAQGVGQLKNRDEAELEAVMALMDAPPWRKPAGTASTQYYTMTLLLSLLVHAGYKCASLYHAWVLSSRLEERILLTKAKGDPFLKKTVTHTEEGTAVKTHSCGSCDSRYIRLALHRKQLPKLRR